MYTLRISKNKTLLKANGNFKPYPYRGKKNAKRVQTIILAYKNDPENAQEIKDKRILKQTTFDTKKAARIAAGWTPKDNSHYLEYLTHNNVAKTLFSSIGSTIKAEAKRRAEQSKQDIAKFKAAQAKWKEEYVPTGNKADNPAFNGYNDTSSRKARRLTKTCNNKFQNKREMLLLNKKSVLCNVA